MPAAVPPASSRSVARPIQLVLVRANGPLFYSLAIASILESAVPRAADRLTRLPDADGDFTQWIREVWLPMKAGRAQQLRSYVESTWPEYDWAAGEEQYRQATQVDILLRKRRATAAHETLARCIAAAQGGVFYRTLARWADDPKLRELARRMAEEEAAAFAQFRAVYDRCADRQRFGCGAAWRAALGCVRAARDGYLARCFDAVSAHCVPHVPFPVLEYPEFLARMSAVVARHGQLGRPERVLLRVWQRPPRVRVCASVDGGLPSDLPFRRAA